jgi:N-acetylglutamate synthase-like GNAT family acetyltransferase
MMDRLKCRIRPHSPDDESMLLLLASESLQPLAEERGRGADFRASDVVELLRTADVYVAECEENVAGFVAVNERDDVLAIEAVCVGPAYEARGVAHQLLDWAEGLAFSLGAARLEALVPADDQRALHLFAGHEFLKVPSTADMLVLEKRLPEAPA